MGGGWMDLDVLSASATAAEGVGRSVGRGASAVALFWGDRPSVEIVHRKDVPGAVARALTTGGGGRLVGAVRSAVEPLLLVTESLRDDAGELKVALRAHGIPALAVFPLAGEEAVVGCVVVPLVEDARARAPEDAVWSLACQAFRGLQVATATVALRSLLAVGRGGLSGLIDGVLVSDACDRVLLSHGLFRALPGCGAEDPFGRHLGELPGGPLMVDIAGSTVEGLQWAEHLLPPMEGCGVPVALASVPLGPPDGLATGSRIFFVHDLRTECEGLSDTIGVALGLAMRTAYGAWELEQVLDRDAAQDLPGMLGRMPNVVRDAKEQVRAVVERAGADIPSVDLNSLLEEVLRHQRDQHALLRIRVFSFLRPQLAPAAVHRLDVLWTVTKLLGFARGSLKNGGGTLTVRTWLEDRWVCVAISDDGTGVAGRDANRAFEALFDPERERSDWDAESDDVAVVRQRVLAVGGRFDIESRPGVWTRYTIMLPSDAGTVAVEPQMPASEVHVRVDAAGCLEILVVDDNAALRAVVRRFLERRGHLVTEAVDGEDALNIVQKREFDRIVLDVQMPGTDGPTVFRQLARVAPTLQDRTVFMTGGAMERGIEDFLAASGRPSLKKPFDLAEVARTLEAG